MPGSSPSGATSTAAGAWRDGVLEDFRPLAGVSLTVVRTTVEWRAGRATGPELAARIDTALPSILETRQALAARGELPDAPQALAHYRAAADLYLVSMNTLRTATGLRAGPLQEQLARSATRMRDLGDRVFDQAGVVLEPLLPPTRQFDGVEVRKPAEVPDYATLDLAAGPPLDEVPATPGPIRTYEAARPEQRVSDWVSAVGRAGVPTSDEVVAALRTGAATEFAVLARRLVAASDAVRALPDPERERPVSTQVQLGLLVQAESVWAAQAAILVAGDARRQLLSSSRALANVADRLWPSVLGKRTTAVHEPS
jgi:hypothetical protein